MPNRRANDVSVVGLGKLGLCLAAVLSSRGFRVKGVDLDASKVEAINRGVSPFYEPGLEKLLRKVGQRLVASISYSTAIEKTNATFVVVPTPSDDSGAFSLRYVIKAMESVGKELAEIRRYHLVVLTSTVMPGSMDGTVKPLLEGASGKICGRDFGLCYNPEFIALGDVIGGLLRPDFILIGESDTKAGLYLSEIQHRICTNSPPIERMKFVNAELSKIALNSFVTMKISFANTLAEISEKTHGGDVDVITSAIGRDKRIGSAYLKGALGYGGPCFPRDNIAFARYAKSVDAQARLAEATHIVNIDQTERLIMQMLKTGLQLNMGVGVLGLSYKPNTSVVEQSQSLLLAQRLSELGHEVNVFDPAAVENSKAVLGDKVSYFRSARACVKASDYVILATPWPEFKNLNSRDFEGKTVFDCWRFLRNEVKMMPTYFSVGRGEDE